MRNAILKKLSGGGVGQNPLRGDTVEGETNSTPVEGGRFLMFAESIDPDMDFRLVETSTIKVVVPIENGYRFETQNSIYEVVYLS